MPNLNDLEYLARRQRDSLARAEAASDPSVAKVHRDFADMYGKMHDAAEAIINRRDGGGSRL